MERSPVESSHLASMGFDRSGGRLHVEFRNGAIYEYDDVSEGEYEAVLREKSRGRAFARLIRPKGGRRIG
ncbi:MAG: KTSC domain-containing protein [Patescibacteria group bacterium]|nr:KTSC domain-containing protein [Patescibacteria group bacterium]